MDSSSLTGRRWFQNSRTTLKHHSNSLGSDFNLLKKTNIHTEFRKTNYGKYNILKVLREQLYGTTFPQI